MNTTKIHTTKKLQKLVKKRITNDQNWPQGKLGKWNATVFYVDRKKCWLLTNGLTKYSMILTNIKSSDLAKIESIFKETLYAQLIYDGIVIDFETLDALIGKLAFLPTDNDRQTTGFQKHRIQELERWKYEFEKFENMPMKDLAGRMNNTPIHIGKGRKMSDYTKAKKEMQKLINT